VCPNLFITLLTRSRATVVSIPYVGFSQVPWKARKPNKAASNKGETPKTKPLYVACDYATDGATRERTIRTMSLYSFKKISAQEKGERNDGMVSLVSVGDTLLFHCSEYHFETKAKAEDECFPRELSVIPEFSMVAITVKASAEERVRDEHAQGAPAVAAAEPLLVPLAARAPPAAIELRQGSGAGGGRSVHRDHSQRRGAHQRGLLLQG